MAAKGQRLVNTLGELATKYGFTIEVLIGMIDMHPDLKEKIKPFREANKKIYPPGLIEEITSRLGEP